MQTKEYQPKPGSARAKVLNMYGQHSKAEIMHEADISLNSLNGHIKILRRKGILQKPTKQDTALAMQDSWRERGAHASLVRTYEGLDFTSTEISAALKLFHNVELNPGQALSSAKGIRRREQRPKELDTDKRSKLAKTTRYSPLPTDERVKITADALAYLLIHLVVPEYILKRNHLLELGQVWKSGNVIAGDGSLWQTVVAHYSKEGRALPAKWSNDEVIAAKIFLKDLTVEEEASNYWIHQAEALMVGHDIDFTSLTPRQKRVLGAYASELAGNKMNEVETVFGEIKDEEYGGVASQIKVMRDAARKEMDQTRIRENMGRAGDYSTENNDFD